jgi:hypothetical protein
MGQMKSLLEDQIEAISEDTAIPPEVVREYFDNFGIFGEDIEELKRYISDANYGQYRSAESFAEEILNNFVDIEDEWWSAYIDYKRMGEDLLRFDYFSVTYGNYIWIFRET